MKDRDKLKKGSLFEIFKKEWEISKKTWDIHQKPGIIFEELREEYGFLSQMYEKLLTETMKITRVGDVNYKKLMEANDQVRKQKGELEDLNRELREANAIKDKFYSIIAHDLKNPLQFLLLSSGLLATDFDQLDHETVQSYLKKIFKTSKNLSELLENLLQWSVSQYGQLNSNPQRIDLHALARENIDQYGVDAEQKEITLVSEIRVNTFAQADENMIKTVLRNLVSNAVKFTNTGGEVTLSAREDGNFIITAVKDTGIGIPAKSAKPFFSEAWWGMTINKGARLKKPVSDWA